MKKYIVEDVIENTEEVKTKEEVNKMTMKNYNCIAVLENGVVRQYTVDANDAKHAKDKLYMIMAYEGITNVYKINIKEDN